jgi:acetyl-CoA carboxylase carboxyl transferase subunit alpha
MIIGTEKGNTTQERLETNFGMAMPEGYRKAKRLMEMADRFNLPILTFIDTAGAYPGIGAEERGQAEAIARSIETSLSVNVPIVAVILGEGGSGGAVALATADKVLMLEHSIYSVISPEGCASILWRSSENATNAANSLRLTAQDLYSLNIIDSIIKEPLGAAHRDHQTTLTSLGDAIESSLKDLLSTQTKSFRENRRKKFIAMTDNKLI